MRGYLLIPGPMVTDPLPTSKPLVAIRTFVGSPLLTVTFGPAEEFAGTFASCIDRVPCIPRPITGFESVKLGCGALPRRGPRAAGAVNPGGCESEICASTPLIVVSFTSAPFWLYCTAVKSENGIVSGAATASGFEF